MIKFIVGTDVLDLISQKCLGKKNLSIQKEFMVSVINKATDKYCWETLDYEPKEEYFIDYFAILKQMFIALKGSDIDFDEVGSLKIDQLPQEDWNLTRCLIDTE